MSKYLTQYELQGSAQLQRRVAACAASLGVKDPDGFAYDHRWRLAVTPGWVELYDAEAAQMPEPETEYTAEDYPDPSWVIPDEQILDVVQAILSEQAAAAGSSTTAPGDSLAPGESLAPGDTPTADPGAPAGENNYPGDTATAGETPAETAEPAEPGEAGDNADAS